MTAQDHAGQRTQMTLADFEQRRSPLGLFKSYCRARIVHWPLRQVLPIFVLLLLSREFPLLQALLPAVAIALADGLDVALLRRSQRSSTKPEHMPAAQGIGNFTAAAHGIAVAVAIVMLLSLGPEMRFIAVVMCIGMILDSALQAGLNPQASIARTLPHAILLCGIFLTSWANVTPDGMTALLADSIAAVLMLMFGMSFIGTVQHQRLRGHDMQRATLQQAESLSHMNATLTEARQKNRRLAHVVEQTQDAVVVIDSAGTVTWSNPAFDAMIGGTGARHRQDRGTLLDMLRIDRRDAAQLRAAITLQTPMRMNFHRADAQGTTGWLDLSLSPMRDDPAGDAFVAVFRDITAQKQRERALAEARTAAEAGAQARTTFLATMSHEIRTPMNGVIATSDLLLDTDLDSDQRALVETIASSGDALLTIINDVLDFTKLEAGKLETGQQPFRPLPLLRSVADLVTPLAEAKGLALDLDVAPDLPDTLLGDEARIRQVLLNLLGNAIKFTETGTVGLSAGATVKGKTCALQITVADSGIGIEPERQEEIFQTFTQADATITRRFGGTGLGLTISRSLARAMGGDIALHSQPGAGSRFTLSLALTVARPLERTAPPGKLAQADPRLKGLSLLIAEDNRTNRMLLGKMLAGTGANLRFAEDGAEALRLATQDPPEMILMDMSMPVMDGLEATRRIRAAEAEAGRPACTILALTANAFEEDRRRCLDAGMDGHLTKPVRKQALLRQLIDGAKDRPAPGADDTAPRAAGAATQGSAPSAAPQIGGAPPEPAQPASARGG